MDIQEFEGLLHAVITDESSTEACRKGFEKNLARLEARGEEYVKRTFLRHRKFFCAQILKTVGKNQEDGDERAAAYGNRLQHDLTGASKAEAFDIVRKARKAIRQSIPEYLHHDEIDAGIKKGLSELFSGTEMNDLVTLVENGKIDAIVDIGFNFSGEAKLNYFETVSDLLPGVKPLAEKFGKLVYGKGKKDSADKALRKIEAFGIETVKDMVLYGKLAKMAGDETRMKTVLKLLKGHLDDRSALFVFTAIAKKLQDRRALQEALEIVEDDREEYGKLLLYAEISRQLKDEWRMEIAAGELEPHIARNENCLVHYAALVKDLRDEPKMELAMLYLVDRLDNPNCLTVYASMSRILHDEAEMKRCLLLLEPKIDSDEGCLRTYASLARALNDKQRRLTSLLKLKEHLSTREDYEFYSRVAEGISANA